MAAIRGTTSASSPWRSIFEDVRREVSKERDEHGMVGSINWLRAQMLARGANPNVVRNIIYRDKGKLPDKRVLYTILDDLWRARGHGPLRVPELEAVLAPGSGNDHEVLQLLGREKRRAYRTFVQGVRTGAEPKLAVTGRPGSGKTLLADYVQQALETEPRAADRIVRLEFSGTDLGTALSRLGVALGAEHEAVEAKLVKIGSSSAFAVQADAQGDVARTILDAARSFTGTQVLLVHVSQSIGGQDSLGLAPLRLNTPEVPRVSAAEWLWISLFEPLSRLPRTSLLVSMTDLPVRALQRMGAVEGPIKLTPPTVNEARRFVRAHLPDAPASQHEEIVQRAGRSFEELRTLTVLAEIRDAGAGDRELAFEKSLTRLSQLVDGSTDPTLQGFLRILGTLSLPEFPTFSARVLHELRATSAAPASGAAGVVGALSNLELAFLDAVPAGTETYRCFSRRLAQDLRETLRERLPDEFRALNATAAGAYRAEAERDPTGEAATRYLTHLFEARDWAFLAEWMAVHGTQQAVVRRIWRAATQELPEGGDLERLARQVAAHYVNLGSYRHQDVRDAFTVLAASADVDTRVWTALQRAEGLTLRGHFDQAEAILASVPEATTPRLRAETVLAHAAIARWRGRPDEASRLVHDEVGRLLGDAADDPETRSVRVKAALWGGLIAKDRGDLAAALESFELRGPCDDLMAARIAFQRGDVFMRLGQFGRALQALDEAVALARRSDALVAEQTRYLARRGTVLRRRGDVERAAADFAEARRVLLEGRARDPVLTDPAEEAELAFWLARVDDEAALNQLARGHFDEACLAFERDIRRFERYGRSQGVDSSYRMMRSTLRLGLAYGCRGVAQPFRRPFPASPALAGDALDLVHARTLLRSVLERIEASSDREHLAGLERDALLAANMFVADGAEALDLAQRALGCSVYPYQVAQVHTHSAFGAIRAGDPETADRHVRAAERSVAETVSAAPGSEAGDVELEAWLTLLDAHAAILMRDPQDAGERIAAGLARRDLRVHHEALLHHFGDAAERAGMVPGVIASELGAMLSLHLPTTPLRFADALVARWREATHGAARPAPVAPAAAGAA